MNILNDILFWIGATLLFGGVWIIAGVGYALISAGLLFVITAILPYIKYRRYVS